MGSWGRWREAVERICRKGKCTNHQWQLFEIIDQWAHVIEVFLLSPSAARGICNLPAVDCGTYSTTYIGRQGHYRAGN